MIAILHVPVEPPGNRMLLIAAQGLAPRSFVIWTLVDCVIKELSEENDKIIGVLFFDGLDGGKSLSEVKSWNWQ